LNVAPPRGSLAQADGRDTSSSYVLYQQLREAAGNQAHIVAKAHAARRKFGTDPDSKERVLGEAVTEDFFDILGVPPAAGRLFVPGDDGPAGGRRVAVLSHRFWTTRFSGDTGVLGRAIYYDETPFTVVGVAARGFDGDSGWLTGRGRHNAARINVKTVTFAPMPRTSEPTTVNANCGFRRTPRQPYRTSVEMSVSRLTPRASRQASVMAETPRTPGPPGGALPPRRRRCPPAWYVRSRDGTASLQ
jgi:hypothetical protein